MYLNKIMIENMGAIEKFYLDKEQLIKADGTPRVIVLVGKNGTGKTTLMSGIVDALYELSNSAFSDILPKEGFGHKYFKVSGSRNIRSNASYGFNYLKFSQNVKNYEYFDKSGVIDTNNSNSKIGEIANLQLVSQSNLSENKNSKQITPTQNDDEFMNNFSSNSYCYFPSDRYELPYWMNESTILSNEQFKDNQKFSGQLDREILVRKSLKEVKNWILDVYLDSKVDFRNIGQLIGRTADNQEPLPANILFGIAIQNIESILSSILKQDARITLNFRNYGHSRIRIIDSQNQQEIVPTLDNLSAGQSTLLGIFATIIQYSDKGDLNKSINLHDIEGVVIIDEVDLHLHIELQHDVLPQLIKLFPKVQFIVSSHSPFFLAGITKAFNEDDYLMLNMPNGNPIEKIDDFEEFTKSYELFIELTESHIKELKELRKRIEDSTRPLIITEGKTDWKHLKAAFEQLKNDYPNLDFEFHEFENLNMGNQALSQIIDSYSKVPSNRKIIAIFDRDDESINKKYSNEKFKRLNENLFVFCIPAISEDLDKISTEYYYKNDDLKRVDTNGRRLFDGLEFDSKLAISNDKQYITSIKNDAGKLRIIDCDVYLIAESEDKNSIALSKNDFAENILHKKEGFEDIDFENFRKIFDIIQTILNPTS